MWQRAILLISLTVLPWLCSGQGTAKTFEEELKLRYEQALLDSLIGYELLKPRYFALGKSHQLLTMENVELKLQMRLLSFDREGEREKFAKQIEVEKHNVKRIRRRLIGVVIVGVIAVAALR